MQFDLFLSHNAREKEVVRRVAARLLDQFSIRCWLDEWDLAAGTDWNAAVERALRQCGAAAIFLGRAGWGEAHLREARAALERAGETADFLVIPVLLPGATADDMAVLGDFFFRKHRVDLTGDDAIDRLALAVRDEAHGPPVMTAFVIRRDAQRWHVSNGDRSLLYRGAVLEQAQRLALSGGSDLDDGAVRFLTASVDEEKRILEDGRRRSRRVIAVLTTLVVAFAVATFLAIAQRQTAKRETARALAQQHIANEQRRLADEQRRLADAQRREVIAQMHRASAANLMELGRRVYNEEPLTALWLTAEALVRVPPDDRALAERVLASARDMVTAGRLARIAVSAEKPIAVGDTDFFIINEAHQSTLRRRFDGAVIARLPLKVADVISDEMRSPEARVPYFLVSYAYQGKELRRKRDGSVVTEFDVESITRAALSFTLVKYHGGEVELRHDDHDTVAIPLTAPEPKIEPIEGAHCFLVSYRSAPGELRTSKTGETIATFPHVSAVQVSRGRRMFAIPYSDGYLSYQSGRRLSRNARVALFDARCRQIALPERAAAVSFDPRSSRYVVAYHEAPGEIRSTDSDEVTPLPAPVDEAVFVGPGLFITYQASITELRAPLEGVLATWPSWIHVTGVAGSERALVALPDNTEELVNVHTGDRKAVEIHGWPVPYGPVDAGPLQYFVTTKYEGPSRYNIYSTSTGERVWTSNTLASTATAPWVVSIDGERPFLFDLRDGRRIPLNVGFERVPLHTRDGVIPDYPSISLQAWPGIPFMIVGSVPSEIRRISDGSLVKTMPARCGGATFNPDRTLLAVRCEHVVHAYEDGGKLVRAEAELYSTYTGRKVATLAISRDRPHFTAQGTIVYDAMACAYHLRANLAIECRSLQVSDGKDWMAVQYGTTRSELWHDDGPASLRRPVARLPDGAVLIGADVTGRRVVVWEPNGATLLIDGDLLESFGRNPLVTPDAVLHAACTLIDSFPGGASGLGRFALGERLRACDGLFRR